MSESLIRSLAIAQTTVREVLRGKALLAAFGFAVVLLAIISLFGAVTIGDQVKVIKDFGLFIVSLFPIGFVVISGSSLLHQELSKKTVYNILSKPVRRSEFVTGKYLGMLATSSLLLIVLAVSLSLYLAVLEGLIDTLLFEAYLFAWLELIIVCGIALFFSSLVVTPALAGLFAFGVFLAGRSTEYLLYFINEGVIRGAAEILLRVLYWTLPHLNSLYISNSIVHGQGVGGSFILWNILYSIGYGGILLLVAQQVFGRRDFN